MSSFFASSGFKYEHQKNSRTFNYGLIIYWNKNEIPQEVLFIPYKKQFGIPEIQNIKNALDSISDTALIVYFQGMRWNQKDLEVVLFSSPFVRIHLSGEKIIPLDFDKKSDNARITFGILACDTSHIDSIPHIEKKVSQVNLAFEDKNYHLQCVSAPREFGYTMYFIKYNAENYFYSIDVDSLKKNKFD